MGVVGIVQNSQAMLCDEINDFPSFSFPQSSLLVFKTLIIIILFVLLSLMYQVSSELGGQLMQK